MDVVNIVFSLLSVVVCVAALIVSALKFKTSSSPGIMLLLPSALTLVLAIMFAFFSKNLPVEVFCFGTAFYLMSALPFTSCRFKIAACIVFVIITLLICVFSLECLAAVLTSYYLISWIIELKNIKTNKVLPESFVSISANYILMWIYVFPPILVSILNLLLSRWDSIWSYLLVCFLLVLSWFLFSFVLFKLIWADKFMIHTDLLERIKNYLTPPSNTKEEKNGKTSGDKKFKPELYEKFCIYLIETKVFLRPDLKITAVASALLTNKTYLSKSISENSGSTFPNIINSMRVNFAIECFKTNPHLKIIELARMSGFGTDSHFSLAFRNVTGLSPRDWIVNYKYEHYIKD